MKIRIWDRLAAAVTALLLIALAAVIVTEGFLGESVVAYVQRVLTSGSPRAIAAKVVGLAVLLVLAVSQVSLLLRRRAPHGNVCQETDNGELTISIKAIEGLVQKCVETHGELQLSALHLESQRDGLVIDLRISLGSSVSIPLVVDALQKQVKQYITACTGLAVRSVRVHVDTAQANVGKSPFDLPDMLGRPEEKPAEKPVEKAEQPGERPVHQRLVEDEEVPVTMPPAPPVEVELPVEDVRESAQPAPAAEEAAEAAGVTETGTPAVADGAETAEEAVATEAAEAVADDVTEVPEQPVEAHRQEVAADGVQ